jgi:hypothetical protein
MNSPRPRLRTLTWPCGSVPLACRDTAAVTFASLRLGQLDHPVTSSGRGVAQGYGPHVRQAQEFSLYLNF